GCVTDDCGRTSATSRPSTTPSPPSTRPSDARGRRSSAFVRERHAPMLAVIQVRRLDAFWTTNYGFVLSAKLGAVAVLLALGAVTRYALPPRVVESTGTAARRLAVSSVAEVLIGLVVLGLVASWRFTPLPRALLAAAEAAVPLHIHTDRCHDRATTFT